MKHSKGNWNYKKVGKRFFIGLENYPTEVRTDTNVGYICEIAPISPMRLTEQDEANAKLISQAPQLLDALIMAYSFMIICPEYQGRQILETLKDTINAATKTEQDNFLDKIATNNANMHPIFADALKPFGIK